MDMRDEAGAEDRGVVSKRQGVGVRRHHGP